MSVRRSKTLVLAATRADAIKWCRQNNVGPYARDTYIATTEANLRGFELHDGDRVVVVSLSWPLIQAWSVVQHMADEAVWSDLDVAEVLSEGWSE